MLRSCLWAAVAALLFASGCAGYRMGPTAGFDAGSRTIRVNYFANHTLQPRLSEAVAQALRKRLQQDATYRLVSSGEADVVVDGDITRFERSPVSFQPGDVRTTRDEQIELAVKLVAADRLSGTNLLDREIVGRMVVRLAADQTSAERQALTQLAEDFANRAAPLIVDGTW
jgi:hypothetical protein